MSEKIKGRSKHIVEGTVSEIERKEKVERIDNPRRVENRRGILSRLVSFIKRENRQWVRIRIRNLVLENY